MTDMRDPVELGDALFDYAAACRAVPANAAIPLSAIYDAHAYALDVVAAHDANPSIVAPIRPVDGESARKDS